MKATGAIWGFCLTLIPILCLVVPVLRDNAIITATVAAAALGILNAILKYMQENAPPPTEPLAPTSSNASRALGIPEPVVKRESLLKRVLLG